MICLFVLDLNWIDIDCVGFFAGYLFVVLVFVIS